MPTLTMPIFRGIYNDYDRMTFGKYKDELLMDIPSAYFRWLREQDWLPQFPALEKYVSSRDWGDDEDDHEGIEP